MSELLNNKNETAPINSEANQEVKKQDHDIEKLAKESSESQKKHLESARFNIEKQAISNETLNPSHKNNETTQPHHYITKQIKSDAYSKTIKQVQKNLSPSEAKFSKVIHQPIIEAASEFGAKTIARPNSIIIGSLSAFLLGVILIFIAKHIGFYISPLVFISLFVIGYVLGLLLELFVKMILSIFKHNTHSQWR